MAEQPDTLPSEEWRAVVGYEGLYEVSSCGRVRRLMEFLPSADDPTLYKPSRYRIISAYRGPNGYPQARLSKAAKAKTCLVHRLVCEAFHGPAPKGQSHVAHWDGDRANNRAENLRWASPRENAEDRNRHGTAPVGDCAPNRRLTSDAVIEMRRLYKGRHGDLARLSRQFGVTPTQVLHVVKRKHWTHI